MTELQQKVYDALKENIKSSLTMADIAKKLCMSRAEFASHLNHMEKKGVLKKKRPKLSAWIKIKK